MIMIFVYLPGTITFKDLHRYGIDAFKSLNMCGILMFDTHIETVLVIGKPCISCSDRIPGGGGGTPYK